MQVQGLNCMLWNIKDLHGTIGCTCTCMHGHGSI